MSPQRGDLLHNRYELMDLIATGGMGEVWRAHDGRLNRDVAVKLLKPELASQQGFLDRFRIEARNAALLTHPNVCAVFDYGEAETDASSDIPNTAYLVMELVPGEPLSSIITRESPLDPGRVLEYMRQAAAGLGAAHAAGVVHRDVKPGNLLVTPDGTVKITDFGVARASGQSNLTATGQVMGTAQYLAPEQALGERVTPAADVYSLGVVGYQALTGAVPFVRESQVATALAQVNDEPPPLPASIPAPVRDLVMGLLRKEPVDRPANGRELAAAVKDVQAGYRPDLPTPTATVPLRAQTAPTVAMRRGQTQPTTAARRPDPTSSTPAAPKRKGRARLPLVFLLGLLVLIAVWAAYNSYADRSDTPGPSSTVTRNQTVTRTAGTPASEATSDQSGSSSTSGTSRTSSTSGSTGSSSSSTLPTSNSGSSSTGSETTSQPGDEASSGPTNNTSTGDTTSSTTTTTTTDATSGEGRTTTQAPRTSSTTRSGSAAPSSPRTATSSGTGDSIGSSPSQPSSTAGVSDATATGVEQDGGQ